MNNGVIVTATDTNVGKTVFSAALVSVLEANYWKPIQAGLEEETDTQAVARLSGAAPERILKEAYCLKTPCSPHRAAKIDKVTIESEKLDLENLPCNPDRPLIIEGAGGLLVPLSDNRLQIDQFAHWKLPIILCARTELGTINHTLLSVEAIRHRKLPLQGIVFIGDENRDTQSTIAKFSHAEVLGRLPLISPLNSVTLRLAFGATFKKQDFL